MTEAATQGGRPITLSSNFLLYSQAVTRHPQERHSLPANFAFSFFLERPRLFPQNPGRQSVIVLLSSPLGKRYYSCGGASSFFCNISPQ